MKSNGVSCATIKKWSKKILLGLCKLHSKQIIHRDIRLDNIYYQSKSRSLKIGGFGMAKVVRKGQTPPCSLKGKYSTIKLTLGGTTHWMAPDYYKDGKGYDRKVDIWAFGLCVLEMATMEVPYQAEFGDNQEEVQRAVKFVSHFWVFSHIRESCLTPWQRLKGPPNSCSSLGVAYATPLQRGTQQRSSFAILSSNATPKIQRSSSS